MPTYISKKICNNDLLTIKKLLEEEKNAYILANDYSIKKSKQ